MRRHLTVLLCCLVGCSSHPLVEVCDYFKPGHLYPDRVTPYGGVCVRQGPGPIVTNPAINNPVIPAPAPFPMQQPGTPIFVPTLPQPGGVNPVPSVQPQPQPSFPTSP